MVGRGVGGGAFCWLFLSALAGSSLPLSFSLFLLLSFSLFLSFPPFAAALSSSLSERCMWDAPAVAALVSVLAFISDLPAAAAAALAAFVPALALGKPFSFQALAPVAVPVDAPRSMRLDESAPSARAQHDDAAITTTARAAAVAVGRLAAGRCRCRRRRLDRLVLVSALPTGHGVLLFEHMMCFISGLIKILDQGRAVPQRIKIGNTKEGTIWTNNQPTDGCRLAGNKQKSNRSCLRRFWR